MKYKEAFLEFFRTTILAGVSAGLAVVLTGLNTQNGTIDINWDLAFISGLSVFITGLLRFLDKFNFENGGRVKLPF